VDRVRRGWSENDFVQNCQLGYHNDRHRENRNDNLLSRVPKLRLGAGTPHLNGDATQVSAVQMAASFAKTRSPSVGWSPAKQRVNASRPSAWSTETP